ncbi:putative nicotinate phosphoribosyltransferase [Beggiatoa alba B18LD]|uniref:Nicotinate phosphoribosyltransferase n=1 Tax=Beggiatoa alba B18LD TaxID=395493 RepID=I3CCN8_9GAMM|nr:nicotinate phosphoribosyltransferase [Beggiatoa alba]EIJ41381.1 putative nicotinate phosphoribosyltransferase [Beggiatoa alba B18LD]
MKHLQPLYGHSLALLTDLYQLTMAYGYWKTGNPHQEVIFSLFFRKPPYQGGYTITAGLASALELVEQLRFTAEDVAYLATINGNDGKPLFEKGFLDYLYELRFTCDIDAMPEGTIVFPHEPLLRVQGELLQCQLLETALLTLLNYQTLVATKATRVCQAAQGDMVLEFGLRRAQGIDGGLSASRAAYIGGCTGTSNVLAGKLFDMPVKGTHAHSWVMVFPNELTAFQTYANVLPNNCIFLVDTYDTLQGVQHAIEVGQSLRQQGHEMVGIRLDSGDLCELSRQARQQLDQAGFTDALIVASNDLDEYAIQSLKQQGAAINAWGIGTKLVTSYDEPALGGVYKLTAIKNQENCWEYRIKVSEQSIKTTNPGILQVRRFYNDQGFFLGDMLYDILQPPSGNPVLVNINDTQKLLKISPEVLYEDLLIPVMRQGKTLANQPKSLLDIRQYLQQQLQRYPDNFKRLENPDIYPVSLEGSVFLHKEHLINQTKQSKTRYQM